MLFPFNTDAPLYHLPRTTVGLILANSFVYYFTIGYISTGNIEPIAPLLLHFGNGLHPTQWVTSNFLHLNWIHLLGNMLFLWTFGLIVEGKIGWWRILLLYLALGTLTMACTQVAGLGMKEGYGLGASGAIFGLIGMALIWAPENEVHCLLFVFVFAWIKAVKISALACLYFGLQILGMVFFTGLSVSSELIHMLGAVFGLAVGIVMLKKDWVDCENWDAFSVCTGRHMMRPEEREALEAKDSPPPSVEEEAARRQGLLQQIHELLANGRGELALAVHRKIARSDKSWQLPEPELRSLIASLLKQQKYSDAISLMREYVDRFPAQSGVMRLSLAKLLLDHENRPSAARRILVKMPPGSLAPPHVEVCRKLLHRIAQAEQADEQETFEVQDDQ